MESNTRSSQPTDAPPKRFIQRGYSHIFSIVLPLVLINAGILHILGSQIAIKANAEITQVKDDSTTLPDEADAATDGSQEDTIIDDQPVITTYTVKSGDTLSGIAAKFDISVNTIRWANDLTEKTSKINVGDELVILPVSGVEYTVKKGDTLSGIATKFDVSRDDILKYNDIEADAIKVGTKLVLPNAEPIAAPVKAPVKKVVPAKTASTAKVVTTTAKVSSEVHSSESDDSEDDDTDTPKSSTKFIIPVSGGILTQGLHDGNAVDIGVHIGTPVKASAAGTVLIARSGNNGGYGTYIVINHTNGAQTLYGHLSKLSVSAGDKVEQGEVIGLSGNTGKSTGPHLHYLEKNTGARNTLAKYKIGTHF